MKIRSFDRYRHLAANLLKQLYDQLFVQNRMSDFGMHLENRE